MQLAHQVPVLTQIQATTNLSWPSNQANGLNIAYDYDHHVLPKSSQPHIILHHQLKPAVHWY